MNGTATHSTFVFGSQEDLEIAMRCDNSARFKARGRVPLFYMDELATEDALPVFMSAKDLRTEWNKKFPDKPLFNSRLSVRELSETFRAMIKPGGTDLSVRNIVFIPSPESVSQAQELRATQQKDGGQVYKLGEIILTSR